MAKTDLLALASPGSRPMKWAKHEKYCRLRAALLPRAQAFREAGWNDSSDEGAYNHACRLEHRPGVRARIEYLSKQQEDLIAEKRQRIEERLWAIHEANIKDLFETYEVGKTNKDGELEANREGRIQTIKKQRAKLLSELPDEVTQLIEDVTVDRHGNFVPKLYSKSEANRELRKFHNIGSQTDRPESDVSRLSDAELIRQIADQAKELGIEIDLNYRFAQPPKPDGVAGSPTDGGTVVPGEAQRSHDGNVGPVINADPALPGYPDYPGYDPTSASGVSVSANTEAGSRPARKPALSTVFKDTRLPPERPQPVKPGKPL